MIVTPIIGAIILLFVLILAAKTIRVVPQARVVLVQRLGRYIKTAGSGPVFVIPFVDRILPTIDMREQVEPFPPQPAITEDNVTIEIATVIYYQIVQPVDATYEVANLQKAMEQQTITTLRNVVGGLSLDKLLTSRDQINSRMRAVLDEVTEKWGVRVNRVELKDIIPPRDVQQAMEKQMQAEREKRAAILRAEGQKQAAILAAEGEKQAAVLEAEGEKTAAVLRSEGDAQALVIVQTAQAKGIEVVFEQLGSSAPTPEILKYLYIQSLPKIAEGSANKLFVVPSEFENIAGLGATFAAAAEPNGSGNSIVPVDLKGK
ncbi:MAG: SPFH domain-containing protein [Chloroflexota bacterium]